MKSAYAKLSRAKKHLSELEASLAAYDDSEAIRVVERSRNDPFDSRQVIVESVVRVKVEPPTEEWGLIIGDILTNLRGALDHALFGHIIARHPGLTNKEQQSIQFPVVDEQANWPKAEKKYRDPANPWVAQPIWDKIRDNQPMVDESTASTHQLHVLHKLVNLDKHRAVHVVVQRGTATMDSSYQQITELPRGGQPLVDGTVLAQEHRLRPLPGQPTRLDKPRGGSAYTTLLDIPWRPDAEWGALDLMEELVDATSRCLDALQAAGC